MSSNKDALNLAMRVGDAMLRNGAEIYRVEETVDRIARAYDIEEYDFYVLTNGLFSSANEISEDGFCMVRHVPFGSVHLGRLAKLNQLARDISAHKYTVEEAMKILNDIITLPYAKSNVQLFFCGLGCGCYAYLFGGGAWDMVCAFFIGLFLQLLTICMQNYKASRFAVNIFGSAVVTICALCVSLTPLPVLYDKIIIGCIMPLVPGIALTISIRDLFNGDYLCGTIRMIDALLTSACIAAGVGSMMTVYHILIGGIQ